ncbi:LysR family transcriptional regulator [Methylocystis bryophila]|uniref:LysR family transcriptional regulator n=1 Tax=Methylocystis bryophila TaxID=655015 RepID=A0A1W6MXP5_9HYPH|nr:LysR family transcriptional regulator [Methylocystis bryophila]ARN82357.1 LysR family transcriptional regulator [Methylocystis bryophila]
MTELRNFDLNLLVAFKFLMEERSVSRAAERLFISQSAMSHVLQRLRRQLDDPVLVKTAAGMKPTPRAQALWEPVKTILRDVERLVHTPEEFSPETCQKRFVIAASDYVEFTLLPPFIAGLNRRAPDIEIQIRQLINTSPETAIEEHQVDFAIGFDVIISPSPRVCSKTLFKDEIVCICRDNHPDLVGPRISFEQFISSKQMVISRRSAGTGLIDDWLEKHGQTRKVSLVVPNFLSAPWIVANTDLLLSLPAKIAERFVHAAPLKILPIPIELPTYDVIMIWHPLQEKEPDHQWIRQEILGASSAPTG